MPQHILKVLVNGSIPAFVCAKQAPRWGNATEMIKIKRYFIIIVQSTSWGGSTPYKRMNRDRESPKIKRK